MMGAWVLSAGKYCAVKSRMIHVRDKNRCVMVTHFKSRAEYLLVFAFTSSTDDDISGAIFKKGNFFFREAFF